MDILSEDRVKNLSELFLSFFREGVLSKEKEFAPTGI